MSLQWPLSSTVHGLNIVLSLYVVLTSMFMSIQNHDTLVMTLNTSIQKYSRIIIFKTYGTYQNYSYENAKNT
jgi:hypothetical protein